MLVAVVLLAGCSTPATRLRDDPSAAAGLDAPTLERIRRREVVVGDSEAVVRLALGRPQRTTPMADGGTTMEFRDRPRDPNDYIVLDVRYRVVYDPVTRSNVTTTEQVRPGLYPHLRTHLIRVNLHDGRVSAIKVDED